MKALYINKEGRINTGKLKGVTGRVVAFDSVIDEAVIQVDDVTSVNVPSEYIDQENNEQLSLFQLTEENALDSIPTKEKFVALMYEHSPKKALAEFLNTSVEEIKNTNEHTLKKQIEKQVDKLLDGKMQKD